MKRAKSAGLLAAAVLAGGAATLSAATPSPKEVVEQFFKAHNKHDAEASAALCHPDAALWRLGEQKPAEAGRDSLRRFFLDQFKENPKIKSKIVQAMELPPWVGVQEKVTTEPGEPARDRLLVFEVLDGTIRRIWTMRLDEANDEPAGGEGTVALQIEKWNERDLPRLVATYDEGATISDLSTGERLAAGEEALRDRFEKVLEDSPHLRVEVLQHMSLGPWVVYRERSTTGPQDKQTDAIAIYEVRDDRIRRVWLAR